MLTIDTDSPYFIEATTQKKRDRYASASTEMLRIGRVLLREFDRIEDGQSPHKAFWIAKEALLVLSGTLSTLSPNKYVMRNLTYELTHLYPKKYTAIQNARVTLGSLLIFYSAFLIESEPDAVRGRRVRQAITKT